MARRPRKQSYMARRLKLLGMRTYDEYLASALWEANKIAFYNSRGTRPQCFICRKRSGLQLHHCNYAHLGAERPEDLVVLCGGCHLEVHRQVKARACRLLTAHTYVKALRGAGLGGAAPTRVVRAKRRRRPRGRLR